MILDFHCVIMSRHVTSFSYTPVLRLSRGIPLPHIGLASGLLQLKANSHRHARHDKTVLSVLRLLCQCELDSRQLKTVANRKYEV